jgi:hypothetical protein
VTVQEILKKVWTNLGEPTDQDPFTYSVGVPTGFSDAGLLMLQNLNDAQDVLATYVFPDGKRLRFPGLRDWFYFEAASTTGTLAAGQSSPYNDIAGNFAGYAGWTMEVAGESRLILHATSLAAYLETGFSADPSSKDYTLYKREYTYADALGGALARRPLALYGVYSFEGGARVSRFASTGEDFAGTRSGAGTPSTVRIRGQKIIFDVPPSEGRFGVEMLKAPTLLEALADESELPEVYHPALVLYVEQWGFIQMQENDSAYARKRDFEDFLRRRRDADDLEDDRRMLTPTPKLKG